MRFRAVLNRDGGTFSAMDIDAFVEHMTHALEKAGHSVEAKAVHGGDIVAALKEACEDDSDAVMVGGGDGTVSLAAGLLASSGKALAILPAGTMNLFARTLRIPLDPETAVEALATGRLRDVDIARVNSKPFVHQVSIGMHPQLIHLRESIPFRGRLGKMLASARAAVTTLLRPHNLKVAMTLGETELVTAATPSISITNNLYGEGHLPFADNPDGGVLGIYVTQARNRLNLMIHFLNMALGRWRENEQVEIHEAGEVKLRILSPHRRYKCAVDGELCPLEEELFVRLYPQSLKVLVPTDGESKV